MMEQSWFEMPDVRRRRFSTKTWIPLRASQQLIREGNLGYPGYREEYFGTGSLAVPVDRKQATAQLRWMEIGVIREHSSYADKDGTYFASDSRRDSKGDVVGIPLVLEQRLTTKEGSIWHLHQDLVIALGLLREGDSWVRPFEGYCEVARLKRNARGQPVLLEIWAEFLFDYLCARSMGLRLSSYQSREECVEDISHLTWPESCCHEKTESQHWEANILKIHEGGCFFGEKASVLQVTRKDVDPEEDVPVFASNTEDSLECRAFTSSREGPHLFYVQGECWSDEWIDPGNSSPRVRGDKIDENISFIVDARGSRETRKTLVYPPRYLWFRPEVIPELAHRPGAGLEWYSRNTGSICRVPDEGIHFGVNSLGLVNVLAKDIVELSEWQQRIWVGFNVSPDGGVAEELLAAQMKCDPANTVAPETRFRRALECVDGVFVDRYNAKLFEEHNDRKNILALIHRFRATDAEGLFGLAKDISRLTADSIDCVFLRKIVSPPKREKWGSLKQLEKTLATVAEPSAARSVMTPLVGAYELRHRDAHLAGSDSSEALEKVKIDTAQPYVCQGTQLIESCAAALEDIILILEDSRGVAQSR